MTIAAIQTGQRITFEDAQQQVIWEAAANHAHSHCRCISQSHYYQSTSAVSLNHLEKIPNPTILLLLLKTDS
jgi:hypothetical protein